MRWTDPDTGIEHHIYHSEDFSHELAQWHQQTCLHLERQSCWAYDSSGRKALRHQCLLCGEIIGPAKRQSEALPDTPDADVDKWKRYQEQREISYRSIFRRHIAIQRAEHTDFKGQHAAYLQTDAWKSKRAKVIKRANGICEGCLEQPATQVHHLTYEHWTNELLYELVAICRDCHMKAHDKDDGWTGETED
jgi:5-methylcytosine-specific restriction endonuclease McrA